MLYLVTLLTPHCLCHLYTYHILRLSLLNLLDSLHSIYYFYYKPHDNHQYNQSINPLTVNS
nr:MAG TPA: hypothetical protein [Caudoviricetes sp.]